MIACLCDRKTVSADGLMCKNCGRYLTVPSFPLPPPHEDFDRDEATPPITPKGTDPLEVAAAGLLKQLLGRHRSQLDNETPGRLARALIDMTSGYAFDEDAIGRMLKCFPVDAQHDGIVVVRNIPFASVCEHHVLPFTGTCAVAYLPNDRIVGVSKIPRLVRALSRRLQVQERIGVQIADAIMEHVGARGAFVVMRAQHSCMAIRGAECPGEMVTSTARGVFLTSGEARAEALELMR